MKAIVQDGYGEPEAVLALREIERPAAKMPPKQEQMAILTDLLEAGKLTPVVGRTYPLAEVPAAIRRLAAGDTLGKIVITV